MKKLLLFLSSVAVIGAMGSCDNNDDKSGGYLDEGYTESYVIEYYPLGAVTAFYGEFINSGSFIYLSGTPKNYTRYGVFSTDEEAKNKYMEKCLSHGDIGYNSYFYYFSDDYPHTFQDRDFASIEIVSDADFDTAHPAGTSLNDIFYFASTSPYAYIKSGYTEEYDWENASLPDHYGNYLSLVTLESTSGMYPIYGLVSELGENDLTLLGGGKSYDLYVFATLTPVRNSEQIKKHNLTITMTDTTGEIFEASVTYVF